MRSVFVFPTDGRTETVASLDRHLQRQGDSWVLPEGLYVCVDDEQTGHLFCDWDSDDVTVLESAVGHRPTWAVQVDISGRIDGTAEVRHLVAVLLERGGVALDDYSAHPWTPEEIESGAVVDGVRFFDFRTYHKLRHEY
jgi:hypothetical protein